MKKFMLSLAAMSVFLLSRAADPFTFNGSEASSIGIYIAEIESGKAIADYNSGRVFTPASVTKCVTAASALLTKGEDFRFHTTARMYGTIKDRVLEGNIVVTGGGDPTLGSRHFKNRPTAGTLLTRWVKAAGIDSIAGSVLVSEGNFPEIGVSPYWLLEDTPWEYGAGYYGINYRDNSFTMEITPTGIKSISPRIDGLSVDINVRNGAKGDITAMRGEGSDLLFITGTMSAPVYSSRYSMPHPSEQLQADLLSALHRGGVKCSERDVMADHMTEVEPLDMTSPTSSEILRSMMEKSNNLFAEAMLRSLVIDGPVIDDAAAVAAEKKLLQSRGHDFTSIRLLDGCGLAVGNKFTPRFLGGILADMARDQRSATYTGLFPLAGKEGTVRGLVAGTRLAGQLAMKSGSMSGVLCYAGYKLDSSGKPTHTVVIMVNGFTCRTAVVRKAISDYLLTVF